MRILCVLAAVITVMTRLVSTDTARSQPRLYTYTIALDVDRGILKDAFEKLYDVSPSHHPRIFYSPQELQRLVASLRSPDFSRRLAKCLKSHDLQVTHDLGDSLIVTTSHSSLHTLLSTISPITRFSVRSPKIESTCLKEIAVMIEPRSSFTSEINNNVSPVKISSATTLSSTSFPTSSTSSTRLRPDPGFVGKEVVDRVYNATVLDELTKSTSTNTTLVPISVAGELGGYFIGTTRESFEWSLYANGVSNATSSLQTVGPNSQYPEAEAQLDVQMQGYHGGEVIYFNVDGWMYTLVTDVIGEITNLSIPVPDVMSISWGMSVYLQCQYAKVCEHIGNEQYIQLVDYQFIKLGLMGVSLFVSSGDDGALGRENMFCANDTHFTVTETETETFPPTTSNEYIVKTLNPNYPSSSEYVTSVGATYIVDSVSTTTPPTVTSSSGPRVRDPSMSTVARGVPTSPVARGVPTSQSVLCRDYPCATGTMLRNTNYEEAGFTTGGGFSPYTSIPRYQQAAVASYLSQNVTFPPLSEYNPQGRAYPDLVIVGHNCAVYEPFIPYNLKVPETVGGTSCSAPLMAQFTARLALSLGRKLGFLNYLLYNLAATEKELFVDGTIGNNHATETMVCPPEYGFQASVGYDVVYGLGSPNMGVLYSTLVDIAS